MDLDVTDGLTLQGGDRRVVIWNRNIFCNNQETNSVNVCEGKFMNRKLTNGNCKAHFSIKKFKNTVSSQEILLSDTLILAHFK